MSFSNSNFGESLQIDGLTLQNTPLGIAVIPNNLPINYTISTTTGGDIVISVNSTLTGDIVCQNFTINSGITLTTNGYNIYCSGDFVNNGTIYTGYSKANQDFPNSYGGSNGYQPGNSTIASGGTGSSPNGSTPPAPTITNSFIQNAYNNGLAYYLIGAGDYAITNIGIAGAGAYGIYIQAVNITAGTINANGIIGYGNGGGGGGGVILLAYETSYTPGTYNISGGGAGAQSGSGGNGQVLTYQFSTTPLNLKQISIGSTQSTLFTNTITLSAIFNIKTTIVIQINGSTSQPAILYFYIDNNLIQTINAFNGSTTFLSAQQLSIGTHTFSVQGILTSGTTSCTADLSAFLIEQVIGNGG